ncbi:MAG: hypothetical protein K2X91_11205, partial [Thermoleophilia bacterium]|nr:hypothetical protein [Thermoleophilia bacterium]
MRFRMPGALIDRCGALTVTDLGPWPDLEQQFLGKGLLYINRALTHAVNAKGQAIVVTDPPPRDGVTRDAPTGLVQVVLKGRPATGVINDRGDVFGQLIVDNPAPGRAGDKLYQQYLRQAFLLPHDAAEPVLVDAPVGYSIEAMGIDEDGVGLGVLIKGRFFKGEVSHTPVAVRLAPQGKATWERLVPDSALPPGADTCIGVGRSSAGDLLLHLQTPTGRLFPGGVPDGKGGLTMTCPNIVESLSHGGFFRAGKVEPLEPPKGYAAA